MGMRRTSFTISLTKLSSLVSSVHNDACTTHHLTDFSAARNVLHLPVRVYLAIMSNVQCIIPNLANKEPGIEKALTTSLLPVLLTKIVYEG